MRGENTNTSQFELPERNIKFKEGVDGNWR